MKKKDLKEKKKAPKVKKKDLNPFPTAHPIYETSFDPFLEDGRCSNFKSLKKKRMGVPQCHMLQTLIVF